jgi:hypothetical protein
MKGGYGEELQVVFESTPSDLWATLMNAGIFADGAARRR